MTSDVPLFHFIFSLNPKIIRNVRKTSVGCVPTDAVAGTRYQYSRIGQTPPPPRQTPEADPLEADPREGRPPPM